MNYSRIRAEFKGSCLKQDKVTFTARNMVSLFIFYEVDTPSQDLNANFALKDCLHGAVKLTTNSEPDNR